MPQSSKISPEVLTTSEDEKFHFIGGMGELLTAVATLILFIGLSVLLFGVKAGGGISSFVYGNFTMLIGLTLVMSEYITRRKKLVGPSIVLAVVFSSLSSMLFGYFNIDSSVQVHSGLGIFDHFEQSVLYTPQDRIIPITLTFIAHVVFYLRYKTPFMLLIIGALSGHMLFSAIMMHVSWLLSMLYAVGITALAVWYDQQDVQRATRKSDCAFWLHLAGAVVFMQALNFALDFARNPTPGAAMLFLILYLGLTIFAIVINRRAVISTGLIFAGMAVYQLLDGFGDMNMSVTALTLVSIGSMVLVLSLWWKGIRAFVMRFMPESLNKSFPVGHGF